MDIFYLGFKTFVNWVCLRNRCLAGITIVEMGFKTCFNLIVKLRQGKDRQDDQSKLRGSGLTVTLVCDEYSRDLEFEEFRIFQPKLMAFSLHCIELYS